MQTTCCKLLFLWCQNKFWLNNLNNYSNCCHFSYGVKTFCFLFSNKVIRKQNLTYQSVSHISTRFDEESPDRDPAESHLLVMLIDDIHRLNPLDSDIVAALSWLPINLPKNVHIIGTTHSSPEVLKLTPVQRERFKLPDCYIELSPVAGLIFCLEFSFWCLLVSFQGVNFISKLDYTFKFCCNLSG